MQLRPLRTLADLDAALARIDALWNATPGTPEADELDVLITLVESYEAKHHAIPPGDPVEVIRFKMQELKLTQNQLARQLGWSSGRISEVLNRKRELTLAMVKALAFALGIPPGLLVGDGVTGPEEGVSITLPSGLVARLREQPGVSSSDLEDIVLQTLERGLRASSGRERRRAPSLPHEAGEIVCLRAGALNTPHSRLAA